MSNKNFYWFAGDRYLSLFTKKRLLESLSKDGKKWDKQDVSGMKTDKIYSIIRNIPLFGSENIAYIYDGNIKDQKNMCNLFSRLPDNRAFILITEKVDKKSELYSKMKNRLKHFISGVRRNKDTIKRIATFWNGSDDLFDYVFEQCKYDTGKTMSELEKISIYCAGKSPTTIDDISNVFCGTWTPGIDDVFNSILKGELNESLCLLNSLIEKEGSKPYAFKFFYAIIEKILRMNYSQSEPLSKMLRSARSSIDDFVKGKGKPEYLMKNFIKNSCFYF